MPQHHETLSQHRRLRLVADRLRLLVTAPAEALPEPRVRSVFAAEIGYFAESLATHFAHEEEGGYMCTVLVERPDLDETIRILEGEHAELTHRFEAHERKENELIQSTFNTDLGVGD